MSAVSEEDVLAALLLEWLVYADGGTLGVPDNYELPPLVDALVHELLCDWDLERAIADSERRWEVERVEREVLSVLRSFRYPRGRELHLLDPDPSPEEVLRWASTALRGGGGA